jgi:hypothetical protein
MTGLWLERSVGEHILLGSDNGSCACVCPGQTRNRGRSIDRWQFLALVHAASKPDILFEDHSLAEVPIAVPSRGSSLLARTVSTTLDRTTLEQVVLDGFFAKTAIDDLPQEARRAGLQEFGLPFAADPVISKHLARFLSRSRASVNSSHSLAPTVAVRHQRIHYQRPFFSTAVCLRVRRSAAVLEVTSWNHGRAVREHGDRVDLAVAGGHSTNSGPKGYSDQGRAARSYYIGPSSTGGAWVQTTSKTLCVPPGMQEGSELLIEGENWASHRAPAEFRFYSSDVRALTDGSPA